MISVFSTRPCRSRPIQTRPVLSHPIMWSDLKARTPRQSLAYDYAGRRQPARIYQSTTSFTANIRSDRIIFCRKQVGATHDVLHYQMLVVRIIIAVVSEVAKRSPALGALVV